MCISVLKVYSKIKNTIYLIYMKFIFEDIELFFYNYYKTKKFFVH